MQHPLTRRQFSRNALAAMALAATPLGGLSAQPAKKPNILVFVADDAGFRHFGCYGNENIKTPNIDRLAAGGLTADNAQLTSSQCSPSRISLMTGRYPHETETEDLHMPLKEGHTIVPGWLQEQGYFTGHMQKTHYGPAADAQFQWYDPELDKLPAFIDSAGNKPFFMWVAFDDPHRPYQANTIAEPHDPGKIKLAPWLADTPETRQDVAYYYDEIARLDGVVGRMMRTLEERNLVEDTLVMFLSDNGSPFPREKGTLYDSGVKTPFIFHWPGKIAVGKRTSALISATDFAPTCLAVAGMELPSILSGQSLLPGLLGDHDFGRKAAFSVRNWHDTDEHIRSIRSDRYRLIHNAYIYLPFGSPADVSESPSWRALYHRKEEGKLTPEQALLFQSPRPEIEFYDLQEDPWELNNLAANPDYRDLLRDHFRQLAQWREDTNDFPPSRRRRAGHTDRIKGVHFSDTIPPMTNK
ncbi:sulfatase family protein [Marinimicrobium sp. C2-29]|uniref:sulfatase family protein n=1 Tax=Marinimicrobium sp. C2-29 TaxID=3139825 RepID=UPI00313A13A7